VLTWKDWDMKSGPPICALRARARPTSAKDCSGWPTPTVTDSLRHPGENFTTPNITLNHAASFAGWPTPTSSMVTEQDMAQAMTAGNSEARAPYKDSTIFAGWPTPQVHQGPNNGTNRGKDHGGERARMTPQNVPDLVGWATPTRPRGTLAGLWQCNRARSRGGVHRGVVLSE
jgi:hypothetical protein